MRGGLHMTSNTPRARISEWQSHNPEWTMKHPQIHHPQDELFQECLRQLKTEGDEREEQELSWMTNPLHGMCHRRTEEVPDIKKFYQWLEKAGLKDSTEAQIMAQEGQAQFTQCTVHWVNWAIWQISGQPALKEQPVPELIQSDVQTWCNSVTVQL